MKKSILLKKYFNIIILFFIFNFNLSYGMENFKQKNVDMNENSNFLGEEFDNHQQEHIIDIDNIKSTNLFHQNIIAIIDLIDKISKKLNNIKIINNSSEKALILLNNFSDTKKKIIEFLEEIIIVQINDIPLETKKITNNLKNYFENPIIFNKIQKIFEYVEIFKKEMNLVESFTLAIENEDLNNYCIKLSEIKIKSYEKSMEDAKRLDDYDKKIIYLKEFSTLAKQEKKYKNLNNKILIKIEKDVVLIGNEIIKMKSKQYFATSKEIPFNIPKTNRNIIQI